MKATVLFLQRPEISLSTFINDSIRENQGDLPNQPFLLFSFYLRLPLIRGFFPYFAFLFPSFYFLATCFFPSLTSKIFSSFEESGGGVGNAFSSSGKFQKAARKASTALKFHSWRTKVCSSSSSHFRCFNTPC